MTRTATVQLRPLTRREHATLRSKLREVSLATRLHRRYRFIAELRSGHPVAEAARVAGLTSQAGYELLHHFNDSGFSRFERPNNPRGRIPLITARQLQALIDTALTSPEKLGLPFTSWSVRTLNAYYQRKKLLPPFSDEWVRQLLRRQRLSAQRIRTWKHSDDPAFAKKAHASAPSSGAARRARRWSASTSGARSSAGR